MRIDHNHGFSLIELMVVLVIMGIVAAVAVPNLFSGDGKKVDVAASELASAIRFSRAEAIRTATPIGVWYSSTEPKFSLYRLVDVWGTPTPTYDIRHPIDKKLYTLDYSSAGNQSPVSISSVTLKYGGSASNRNHIIFDEHGTPLYFNQILYEVLDEATIVLSLDGYSRTISVSPMVGRVTEQ